MNIISLSFALIFITSLVTTVIFIFHKQKDSTKNIWISFNIIVVIWSLGMLLGTSSNISSKALFWFRFSNCHIVFIGAIFFHFSKKITKSKFSHKFLIYLLVFIYYLFTIFFPETFIKSSSFSITTHSLYLNPGWLYISNPIIFSIFVSLSSLQILQKIQKTQNLKEKNQLKYVLIGFFLGSLGGGTAYLPAFKISIFPWGIFLSPAYIILTSYAIIKHQLMDIHIVIRKSLIYSILIAVITLSYLLLVIGLEFVIQQFFGYNSKIISIIVAFGLGLFIIPLRNRIQYIVDQIIFRHSQSEMAEENERLRQEITRTERLRTVATLASGMAHEIKNPLTAIKIFAEYLPKKIHEPDFLNKFIPLVQREVTRIDELVHQLLEYAKPTPPNMKPTSIISLINETLDFLNQQMIAQRITLKKHFDIDETTLINIDKNQIKQALLNIILNALDATPPGGIMTVNIYIENNALHIKILDTGTGVHPDDLKRIFDPFYSKKDAGTGLGLSITHEIIQQHNGSIHVDSSIGKGTTFDVSLPVINDT